MTARSLNPASDSGVPARHRLPVLAAILLIALTAVMVWLLALPVASSSQVQHHPDAPVAAAAALTNDTAQPDLSGPSPFINAGEVIGGLWELNEPIPGSSLPKLGQRSIILDDAGNAYAVWETTREKNAWCDTSRNVRFAYRPARGAWSAAQTIAVAGVDYLVCMYTADHDRGQVSLAVDKQGRAHVLYVSYIEIVNWDLSHATLFHMVRSPGPNGSWTQPQKVCDQTNTQGYDVCPVGMDAPDLIMLPDGKLLGAWSEDRFTPAPPADPEGWSYDWGIYAAIYDGSTWGAHVRVDDTWYQGTEYGWTGGRFGLSVDAGGRQYAVWQDQYGSSQPIHSATRASGAISWTTSVTLYTPPSGRYIEDPISVADAAGNAHAVWAESSGDGRRNVLAAYKPAGGAWGAPVPLNIPSPSLAQQFPDITVDRDGNAWAAWVANYPGGPTYFSDVYVSMRTAGITGTWSMPEQVNPASAGVYPDIADITVDKSNDVYVLWRGSDGMLHFSRRGGTVQMKGRVSVTDAVAGDLALKGVPVTLRREDHVLAKAVTLDNGAYLFSDVPITTNLVLSVTLEHAAGGAIPTFQVIFGAFAQTPLAYAATLPFTVTASDPQPLVRDMAFQEGPQITTSLLITPSVLADLALIYYHTHEAWQETNLLNQALDFQLPIDIVAYSKLQDTAWFGPWTDRTNERIDPYVNLSRWTSDRTHYSHPDMVEWHEFAHHIMADMLGNLMPHRTGDTSHAGYANGSSTDAWAEGFAEFFPALINRDIVRTKHPPEWIQWAGVKLNIESNYLAWTDGWRSTTGIRVSDLSAEELAVAGLLWDLVDPVDQDDSTRFTAGGPTYADCIQVGTDWLWRTISRPQNDSIRSPNAPPTYTYVFDVKQLYDALARAYVGENKSRGTNLTDLEELFIAHGYFSDTNGNRIWDGAAELPAMSGYPGNALRRSRPEIPGSYIAVNGQDAASGAAVTPQDFTVEVRFLPPYELYSYSFETNSDLTPGSVFVYGPDAQYSAEMYITARAPGKVSTTPLTVTNAFYWQQMATNPTTPFLEHTFIMTSSLNNRINLPLIMKNWSSPSTVSVAHPAAIAPRAARTPRACAPAGADAGLRTRARVACAAFHSPARTIGLT